MSLVAREVEVGAIRRLVAGESGEGVRALVLEGAPGIGKTSLWEQGVAWGREHGRRVLVARSSQAETGLSFAGLIDLFDGVDSDELDAVPGPQLRALEVALYRADPGDRPPEAQVIALAVLAALRLLSEHHPIVVALDDVQWLDSTSEEALAFVARRLRRERVTFLMTRRPGRRTALERALPDDHVDHIVVGGTTLAGTREILATRLGLRLPHHLLRRVHETTAGNPLFALELGRQLATRDPGTLTGSLPIPDHVDDLLGVRVADLERPVRRLLLAIALEPDLRVSQLREHAGGAALDGGVEAGVVTVDGGRVRVAHPLIAAAAQRQASQEERWELHRRIADVVAEEHRRVLHLALATPEADEALARRLDVAAAVASARGATRLAIDLAAHALRLTPPDVVDDDRVLALGQHLHDAGEKQRLTDLLGERVLALPPGAPRVAAYTMLTEGVVTGSDEINQLLEKALAEAGDDPRLRGLALAFLAENEAVVEVQGLERADARASEAVALSEHGTLDEQRTAITTLTWTQALRGHPVDHLLRRHQGLSADGTYLARHPQRVAGQRHVWRGELSVARQLLTDFRDASEQWADAYAHGRLHLCELELRAGSWDEVERMLDEWAQSTDSALLQWPMYERCRGLLAAGRGDVEEARRWAGRARDMAERTGVRWDWLESSRALGQAALLAKDLPEAVRHLGAVWDHTVREGVLDPGAFPAGPDLVEALIESEDVDGARRVNDTLADRAGHQDHPWARHGARRGAALLAVAEKGYDDDLGDDLAAVAAAYGELGLAFDEARAVLALGRAQRRAKKWGAARETLERAVAVFDVLGSPGWADVARAELERSGARRSATEGLLTATERRVADLAVEGLSNKEIARTLVVTVNTVEFHLRNTYAKLGIRSRVQLAAALQGTDDQQP
jgi:DNA-binding CsgD family transcriptional regulator